jgi:hypothetical protein
MDIKEQLKQKEEIILELQGVVKTLRKKYEDKRIEYKELEKKYINLKCRYTNQNDELCKLKVLLSKEGYYDIKRSK